MEVSLVTLFSLLFMLIFFVIFLRRYHYLKSKFLKELICSLIFVSHDG